MPFAVWPTELPNFVQSSGFSSGPRDNRLVTTMEKGPPKVRNRGRGVKPISYTIIVNGDGLARFEQFWEEEIGYGVLPFWKTNPVVDGVPLWDESGNPIDPLTTEDDEELTVSSWLLLQMAQEAPSYSAYGGWNFNITIQVIALP